MRHCPSPATQEEDSYGYRIEWDDRTSDILEMMRINRVEHYGPGSREIGGFDNAWDLYEKYRDDADYRNVRLIRIDSDGNEEIYAP